MAVAVETWHCEVCGARSPVIDGVPTCGDHGARWRMIRNAPCAAAIITDGDGRVLLARRAREPFAGMWEVPGGFVELGEHPADAARREVFEELGVTLTLTGLVGIYVSRSGRGQWLEVTVYRGEVTGTPAPEASEVTECHWFARDEVPEVLAADHRRRLEDWWERGAVPLPAGGAELTAET